MEYNITKDQYLSVLAAWKSKDSHTAEEHIIYNLLRSKPLVLGFKDRAKNIQGNDPWFAFNVASAAAKRMLSNRNPWAKQTQSSSFEREEERIKQRAIQFKATFGIDIPEIMRNMTWDNQS